MRGLTIRWSLVDTDASVLDELARFVEGASHARFTGLPGLAHKTWRAVPGDWFEGCYVFDTVAAREGFQQSFTAGVDEAPGTRIVGARPVLVEACRVVAVAEGAAGFHAAARVE